MDGIAWAAGLPVPGIPANAHPAKVINLSLSGPGPCPQIYTDAFSQALVHGATRAIVIAAGNDGADVSTAAPGNCPGAIAVAATTRAGSLASYSNFGAGIVIAAPGGESADFQNDYILTLGNSGTTVSAADSYEAIAGTSVAAPIVSGVVSLMLSVAPNLTAAQIRSILQTTAKPFPGASNCNTGKCGAGIVDAHAAVAAAQALAGTSGANYQGLWWRAGGTESGWGVNLADQGDQIFATWYTYDAAGKAWWLSMLANRTTGETFNGVIYTTSGPPFNNNTNQTAFMPAQPVGNGILSFTDANNGSFSYTVNGVAQTKPIARYDLGTGAQPLCTYSPATPNFSGASNYQDLWWVANGAESGWGINFAHQGRCDLRDVVHLRQHRNAPLWLSVLATFNGSVYTGTLYRTAGPTFSSYNSSQWAATPTGTASIAFADGNHATFGYTTSGQDGLPAVSQTKQVTRFPFASAGGTLCH